MLEGVAMWCPAGDVVAAWSRGIASRERWRLWASEIMQQEGSVAKMLVWHETGLSGRQEGDFCLVDTAGGT